VFVILGINVAFFLAANAANTAVLAVTLTHAPGLLATLTCALVTNHGVVFGVFPG
jgi:flagellar biosynthesis protein FliQ